MPFQPFLGEIAIFTGNFAPHGWAFCNGQLLSIAQFTALFSILGTTYGGDGRTTFGLPDFRGRVPVHAGQGDGLSLYDLGQADGSESVTLLTTQMPQHNHGVAQCNTGAGNQVSPVGGTWAVAAAARNIRLYSTNTANAIMNPLALSPVGGNQPHQNLRPVLAVSFIIALQGIFPARN